MADCPDETAAAPVASEHLQHPQANETMPKRRRKPPALYEPSPDSPAAQPTHGSNKTAANTVTTAAGASRKAAEATGGRGQQRARVGAKSASSSSSSSSSSAADQASTAPAALSQAAQSVFFTEPNAQAAAFEQARAAVASAGINGNLAPKAASHASSAAVFIQAARQSTVSLLSEMRSAFLARQAAKLAEVAEPVPSDSLEDVMKEGDSIDTVRKEQVFRDSLTENDLAIIEKRIALQKQQFEAFKRKDAQTRIKKLLSVYPYLTEEEARFALEECRDEDDAILKFADPTQSFLVEVRKKTALHYNPNTADELVVIPDAIAPPAPEQQEAYRFMITKRQQKATKTAKTATVEQKKRQAKYNKATRPLSLKEAMSQLNTTTDAAAGFKDWSEARIRAYKSIDVNPNAYYYRFNAPNEEPRNGAWTQDEKQLFFERLREIGADGQWGIFSMAIPGRVGYQCSNFYRKLIRVGELKDNNYLVDPVKGSVHYLFTLRADDGGLVQKVRQFQRKRQEDDDDDDDDEEDEAQNPVAAPMDTPSATGNDSGTDCDVKPDVSGKRPYTSRKREMIFKREKRPRLAEPSATVFVPPSEVKPREPKRRGRKTKLMLQMEREAAERYELEHGGEHPPGPSFPEFRLPPGPNTLLPPVPKPPPSQRIAISGLTKVKPTKGRAQKNDSSGDEEFGATGPSVVGKKPSHVAASSSSGNPSTTAATASKKNSKRNVPKEPSYEDDEDMQLHGDTLQWKPREGFYTTSRLRKMRGELNEADMIEAGISDFLPDLVDPITLDRVVMPAISPAGHVMSYSSWLQCIEETGLCPLTKSPMRKRDLVLLTPDNIEQYRDKIFFALASPSSPSSSSVRELTSPLDSILPSPDPTVGHPHHRHPSSNNSNSNNNNSTTNNSSSGILNTSGGSGSTGQSQSRATRHSTLSINRAFRCSASGSQESSSIGQQYYGSNAAAGVAPAMRLPSTSFASSGGLNNSNSSSFLTNGDFPYNSRVHRMGSSTPPQLQQQDISDLDFLQQYVSVPHPNQDAAGTEDRTTVALENCQKTVVAPMTFLLTFLAWRPFSRVQKPFSFLYFVFFLSLLFYNYVYDIVVCQQQPGLCPNLISKFIVPDCLHLASYLYGLYYFRLHSGFDENTALIETVFLQSTTGSIRTLFGDLSQSQLVKTLRWYLAAGIGWLAIRLTYNLVKYTVVQTSTFDTGVRSMTTIFMVVATFAADCVYVVIVTCYAIQCRLLLFYIDGLRNRINQRQHPLSTAMKELMQIQRFVKKLNNGLGKVVGLSVFMFTLLTISPFVLFLDKDTLASYTDVHKGVVLCELAVWLLMLGTTLVQAARLTAKCLSLKDVAIVVRHEGHLNATTAELDSFMLFTINLRMPAKIFAVTVTAGLLMRAIFVSGVIVLMLFQIGAIQLFIGAN
ncbi:hypothetical protein CAOG_08894 [Capsaspora owczarzaki ATCC 30864]|uniref:Myb-like domain-containing protein n=1 Tax=Capsaspora owczarzaki (strain ATCC 30864) TaxID=595528 RepID=A0A0D2WS72_CAPO3|nr:hypothetical protein CAOG_08894 [Capsaspora owczarzaki ATCC 30864]KJE94945.1 hypothetical protein CAOG_008894 [Capsaspora owczarzaki ATCC 30864]|eukprot:XP_011270556.1 hypothetical protein CAOG_08894 [Capsaspora owczarzaki ATCC 30864]